MRTTIVLLSLLAVLSCKPRTSDVQSSPSSGGAGAGAIPDPGDYIGMNHNGDGLTSWDGTPVTNWQQEKQKREQILFKYLVEESPDFAQRLGYNVGDKQTPRLAWKWFEETPVGYGGVPYVLLKTILDLTPQNCGELCALVDIWKKKPTVGGGANNLDHLGFGPHPRDYINGVAKSPDQREWPLPYGFVFQSGTPPYEKDKGPYFEDVSTVKGSTYSVGIKDEILTNALTNAGRKVKLRAILREKQLLPNVNLASEKLEGWLGGYFGTNAENNQGAHSQHYADNYADFGKSPGYDNVFFSCAGCHTGRVVVNGKVRHIPGAPNTEVEAQYFSKLLMLTGAALVDGFDVNSTKLIKPDDVKPKTNLIKALYKAMVTKALNEPETLYGKEEQQVIRGYYMTLRVAENFLGVVKDLIGTAIKTHFIYYGVAAQNGYNKQAVKDKGLNPDNKPLPDLMGDRVGQMDAFGIASGLAAIHSKRPDNSFMITMYQDEFNVMGNGPGNSPAFTGFPLMPDALKGPVAGRTPQEKAAAASNRVFANVAAWAPPVPAPIDIKNLFWAKDRYYANWDGNQGANARTLASGTSATGDPRKVNVAIHEPLNPFINYLRPLPYQFDVNLDRAKAGKDIFNQKCASCHAPRNNKIYKASDLGVDVNRSLVNTSVSRNLLAGLVLEACGIYKHNSGNGYCMPEGSKQQEKLANYFEDTPGRVASGNNGYKADMLHGAWSSAPYLHNGSVPTLGHLLCSKARPAKFIRGNINYDQKMVGFVWWEKPSQRYSATDIVLAKEFDTNVLSRSNTGHTFADDLCPDLSGLDPTRDRDEIAKRITDSNSKAGDLLEYLKTL